MKLLFRVIHGVGRWIDGFHARGLQQRPTYGDPQALELRSALEAGRWRAAAALLAEQPQDWARRDFLVDVAGEWPSEPAWLAEWLGQRRDNADALLVAGSVWVHLAWAARGAGYAQTVSNEGIRLFFERLQKSYEMLTRATQREPGDPTAWALLIAVGRGGGCDPEAVQGFFEKAIAADPQHYRAHHDMLQFKCAKWHGSDEEMWAFARASVERATQGSPVWSLIPIAHMEHACSLAGEDSVTDPDRVEREYWSRPQVTKTTVDAYMKFQAGSARMSPDRLAALGDFAYGLWRCGAREMAATAFGQLGDRLAGMPWRTHLFPARTFRKAQRECRAR